MTRPTVPAGVAVVVEIVRTELPPALTDAGLNVPVAPAGRPVTERLTGRAAPDVACVLTVYVVLEPLATAWLPGLAAVARPFPAGRRLVRPARSGVVIRRGAVSRRADQIDGIQTRQRGLGALVTTYHALGERDDHSRPATVGGLGLDATAMQLDDLAT